jgi:hypothetical protein
LTTLREQDKNIPLVSVLFSGRPLLIDDILSNSSAVIAAWLPGTSGGQGIVDAIVGNYIIKPSSASTRNTLSMDWPTDMVIFILFRLPFKTSPFTVLMAWFPKSITQDSLQASDCQLMVTATWLKNDSYIHINCKRLAIKNLQNQLYFFYLPVR